MADYIDREKLMENFAGIDLTECVKYGNKTAEQRNRSYSTMMMYEIAYAIQDAPTADVAPIVHAEWRNNENGYPECTNCGYMPAYEPVIDDIYYSKYCPNCGAKIGGKNEL